MNLFDQAHDIAHAENTRGHALGVEGLERLRFLPDADEHDGFAGDLAHRQCRTPARVPVGLGEDHPGELECRPERPRRVHRVLAGHGVHHEQALGAADRGVDVAHFGHETLIHVQPPGGVHDQGIEHPAAGALERRARNRCGSLLAPGGEVLGLHLARQTLELQHRGRPAHVGAGEQHALALALDQPPRELRRGGGLAGALQARQQHYDRRLRAQLPGHARAAHEPRQLGVQNADERLTRRQAREHLGTERLGPDRLDECLDHRQRDVRFQQRDARLAQRRCDVLVRDPPAAAQILDGARQARRQVVEHDLGRCRSVDYRVAAAVFRQWGSFPARDAKYARASGPPPNRGMPP